MLRLLNAKKTSWTRIDNIEISYKYSIINQDGNNELISCKVNISDSDLKQGPKFVKDWSISNDKRSEIQDMISKADEYKKNQRFLDNEGLEILACLSNNKYSNMGHFTAKLSWGGSKISGLAIYAYLDKNDNKKYQFIGELIGDSFHISSLDGIDKYRKCGLAHILFLLFGLAIPFLESYSKQDLNSIYGTVGDNAGYNPQKSIPFYKKLSGTVLPFGKRMILEEETGSESGKLEHFKYSIK